MIDESNRFASAPEGVATTRAAGSKPIYEQPCPDSIDTRDSETRLIQRVECEANRLTEVAFQQCFRYINIERIIIVHGLVSPRTQHRRPLERRNSLPTLLSR
jgi:hypothetical protein